MKKLTLILSMMLALVGINANAAIYIVGDAPFSGWHTNSGDLMTDNGDGTHSMIVTIEKKNVYFSFANGLTASDGDWTGFQAYRFGPTSDGQTVNVGEWITTQHSGNAYKFYGDGEYVFTFDETNTRFKVEGYVPEVQITSYTVVLGIENWGVNEANDMTLVDGVYTFTKENVQLNAGNFEYKVVGNHDWGFEWPQGYGNNFSETVAATGAYNITITFDPATGESTCTLTLVGDAAEDTYTVAGTVNLFGADWDPTYVDNDMTLNAETGLYTWTKTGVVFEAVDTIEFKVVKNHNWDVASWPENNWWYEVTEAGTYNFEITFNAETGAITFNATKQGGEEPVVTVYTVAGPEAVFGSNWNEADTNNDMTLDAETGLYTWTKTGVELTTAGFGFKVVADHSWDNAWPNEAFANYDVTVEEAGIYSIVITFNADTKEINCVITKTGNVEPVHYDGDVYIMGEVNDNGGWFTNKGVLMTRDAENNLYTATITTAGENVPEGEEVGYSYFSFTKQLADSAADWDAIAPYRFGAVSEGDYWVTDEVLGTTIALQNNGQSFRVPAGTWNLTLSVDNMTLVIEAVAEPSYLRGDVNSDENVTILDVTTLIDYLLTQDADGVNVDAADCNLDEAVTILDVTTLIDYLLTQEWPAE